MSVVDRLIAETDPARLQQVIVNLVPNAAGIEEAVLSRIFEPGWRRDVCASLSAPGADAGADAGAGCRKLKLRPVSRSLIR